MTAIFYMRVDKNIQKQPRTRKVVNFKLLRFAHNQIKEPEMIRIGIMAPKRHERSSFVGSWE